MENITNFAVSKLSAAINASQTTLSVVNPGLFPDPNFRVKIDDELLLITAVNEETGVWTVTRGIESTTATSHISQCVVSHNLTAGSLLQVIDDHSGNFSGDYNDLTNKPDLSLKQDVVSGVSSTEIGYLDGVTSSIQTQINAKANSSSLATVATTGAYNDLSGKPSLATVATTGAYSDLSGRPTLGTVADNAETDFVAINNSTAARNKIQPSANVVPITAKQSSGGSANLLECQADDNSVKMSVDNLGQVYAAYGYGINGGRIIEDGGSFCVRSTSANVQLNNTSQVKFSDTADAYSGLTFDVGIKRDNSNVLKITNGSSGLGHLVCGQINATGSSTTVPVLVITLPSGIDASYLALDIKNNGGTTVFSVNGANGEITNAYITAMINATSTAQSTADTAATAASNADMNASIAIGNAASAAAAASTAQSTADSAASTASSAASAASSAQSTADSAYSLASGAVQTSGLSSALAGIGGYTGTGMYTYFSISNGLITSAS